MISGLPLGKLGRVWDDVGMLTRLPIISAVLLLAWTLAACGSKSPLTIDRYPLPDAGFPDLGVDLGRDAGMPDLSVPDDIPCIPLPATRDAGITSVEVALEARTSGADVAFLVDVTGSMGGVIDQLQREIRESLVPALRAEIPDARFSVSSFADFPVDPYGSMGDVPYITRTAMTSNVDELERAVGTLIANGGGDGPESQTEALYQLATGEGRIGFSRYVEPASCPVGTFGHPCFRSGVLPLVFVFTDVTSHEGPDRADSYDSTFLGTTPATYDDAIAALAARGMPVVTFWAGGDATIPEAARRLARDTGAVDGDDQPLVFGIGRSGTDLVAQVLAAVGTVGEGLATDIDVVLVDPTPSDPIDSVALVSAVVALRAEPADGVERIEPETARFIGVRGSTRVVYRIDMRTDLVEQLATPQEVLLDVQFRADGRSVVRVQRLRFIVPALDGTGCEAESR